MHLGITPWRFNSALSANDLCQQAEQAQAWGFESFWLPERHFAEQQSLPDPLLLLAAVAGRTSTLKLATTSYLLPMRNPLLAAEQIAVLDQLSEGRLILGLGRGFQKATLEAFAIKPTQKRDLFEQTLNVMLQAWRGEAVGSAENPVQLAPLPRQQPHPPLMMAAFGPKALRQAAKHGLPYLASPMESLTQLEENQAIYLAALEEFGHRQQAEIAAMRTLFVSSDRARCNRIKRQLESQQARMNNPFCTADSPWIVGSPQQVADEIARYKERLGLKTLIATRPAIRGIEPLWVTESCQALAKIQW